MKLEQIQDYVVPTIALAVGLGIALGCGYFIGQGDAKNAFAIVGAFVALSVLLLLEKRVWMLIPATAAFGGKLTSLPIPFTLTHLGILIAFGMYLILKALKIVRLKPKTGLVDIWMFIMLAYLATVYVRNPVGVEALGSDRVGGRPYVDIIIAYLAFWVLSRSTASIREYYVVPIVGIAGNVSLAFVNYLAFRSPALAGLLSSVYSGIAAAENPDAVAPGPGEGGRLGYLESLGGGLTTLACCFWRPFTVINPVHFLRFAIFFSGIVTVLLSGFRSSFMNVMEIFLVASYFRRGMGEVLRAAALGVGAMVVLVGLQGNVIDLPFAAQRTLSFLPGKWDYAATSEAADSTAWRVEMWKTVLETDKYIENKWLGDGFGFTHRQLEIMTANSLTGTNADQQENLMISGGVHSGPISTIHYVGYVGLAIYLVLLVLIARRAAQLIRRAQNTPFFPFALIYGLGPFLMPFNFVFIFGAFDNDLPASIIAIGGLKMLENSLDAYLPKEEKSDREIIQPPRARPAEELTPLARR